LNLNFTETDSFSVVMKKKYMRIRFEDFVMSPIEQTQKIYDFVHLDMNMHIIEWLNTSLSVNNDENLSKTSPFDLKKNRMSVLNGWREKLSFEKVKIIQSECRKVLEILEYKIYDNENQLKNLEELYFNPH